MATGGTAWEASAPLRVINRLTMGQKMDRGGGGRMTAAYFRVSTVSMETQRHQHPTDITVPHKTGWTRQISYLISYLKQTKGILITFQVNSRI